MIKTDEKYRKRLTKSLPILRTVCGLKQQDLAKALNLSRQTISNFETGRTRLSVVNYLAILVVLYNSLLFNEHNNYSLFDLFIFDDSEYAETIRAGYSYETFMAEEKNTNS